jgi:hypothetical protein
MGDPRHVRSPRHPRGADGPAWRPSTSLLAVALGIVAGSLGYLAWWWISSPPPGPVADATSVQAVLSAPSGAPAAPVAATAAPGGQAAAPSPAASRPAAVAAPSIARSRDADGDQSPDLADHVNEGERPTVAEVIERLHQAGVHSGLGAFQPPGTRPPLVGLAVPEDFVLPEGYVRHHQATDDGQRIEPILMFSPDHRFLDAAGRPVAVPADRVVPPELAPPGLPIRRIVIPAPVDAGGRGS